MKQSEHLTIRITSEEANNICLLCSRSGMTQSEAVRFALDAFFSFVGFYEGKMKGEENEEETDNHD